MSNNLYALIACMCMRLSKEDVKLDLNIISSFISKNVHTHFSENKLQTNCCSITNHILILENYFFKSKFK